MKKTQNEQSLQALNKQFQPLLKALRGQYNLFILVLIAYTVLNATGVFKWRITDPEVITQLQSMAILVTLGVIPGALRWFGKRMKKVRGIHSETHRESAYKQNTLLRLGLLGVCALADLTGYFLTMNYTFLLMAGMAVAASIFCIPTIKRIIYDLSEETSVSEEKEETNE